MIPKYEPSDLMLKWRDTGKLYRMRGFRTLVAEANNAGIKVYIDLGGTEPDFQEINVATARMAVHETDEGQLQFRKGEETAGMLVIAGNDDDWLCDYHVVPWLETVIQKAKLD